MGSFQIGESFRGKTIIDAVFLSNGWIILKTENTKLARDFKVKTVYQVFPTVRSYTPKHAHFAIDFYGKFCADKKAAMDVFQAIIDIWNHKVIHHTLRQYNALVMKLPGYPLEYILYALAWILEQEDINFKDRPAEKQKELDEILKQLGIKVPPGRLGSQLAISLFCHIALGKHPVEAFILANLDVLPVKRAVGRQ